MELITLKGQKSIYNAILAKFKQIRIDSEYSFLQSAHLHIQKSIKMRSWTNLNQLGSIQVNPGPSRIDPDDSSLHSHHLHIRKFNIKFQISIQKAILVQFDPIRIDPGHLHIRKIHKKCDSEPIHQSGSILIICILKKMPSWPNLMHSGSILIIGISGKSMKNAILTQFINQDRSWSFAYWKNAILTQFDAFRIDPDHWNIRKIHEKCDSDTDNLINAVN